MENNLNGFEELLGKTLSNIENNNNDEIVFTLENGDKYKLYQNQDCCESVSIEDVNGLLSDLVGSPILMADEAESNENPDGIDVSSRYQDSFTWTFYKLATIKGYVTIRWYGESNGYYSESVNWTKIY